MSQRPQNFRDPTYAETASPTGTKFGTITHVGVQSVSRGSATPRPKVGFQRPPNFETYVCERNQPNLAW